MDSKLATLNHRKDSSKYYWKNRERVLLRNKENLKLYYPANREKILARHREYYNKNRDRILAKKRSDRNRVKDSLNRRALRAKYRNEVIDRLGGSCKHCGFSDRRALQIDHVNGNGRKEWRAAVSSEAYYRDIRNNLYSGKYQLLCANCNWIKRYERQEFPPALNPYPSVPKSPKPSSRGPIA